MRHTALASLLAALSLGTAIVSPAATAQSAADCPAGSMAYECLRAESWESAQWAIQTSATRALGMVSARFAAGDDALAGLVAERERVMAERSADQDALFEALALTDETSRATAAEAARSRIAAHEARLAEIDARFERDFPEYAALTNPRPLRVAETQALLQPDEAMLLIMAGQRAGYVFAIDREGIDWARVAITGEELAASVDTLRQGLDPAYGRGPWNATPPAAAGSDLAAFDRTEAYRLYQLLIEPVAGRLESKRHVYAVPSGALSSLPLGVMVTEAPQGADTDIEALRGTAWMARRYAMTVLPSPASLRAVARFGQSRAGRPFLGVGDPCIGARAGAACNSSSGGNGGGRGAAPDSFRSAGPARGVFNADVDAVRSLAALPNTRPELVALAEAFRADPSRDLLVGGAATETGLRTLPDLDQRRVIAFATHGLVADELPDLPEPALVLTPPDQAVDGDDGLLTASEIARDLQLDADWVILSACNTAAPSGSGADSLSGLASAFFYAGARSMLVSHWVVDDAAARRITTGALDAMAADPEAGRAEALRQSLLVLMEEDRFAHPAMWAPFVLVGQNRPVTAQ